MASITYQFFNFNFCRSCPPDVMREIFVWLPIDEFTPVPSVCREWLEISRSDEIWLTFYQYKFLRNNTVMGSMPERPLPMLSNPLSINTLSTPSSSMPPSPLRHHHSFPTPGTTSDTFPTATSTQFEKIVAWTLESQQQGGYYLHAFKSRLSDPHIGDKVEVAWRGKFRLEASEVYQGLAW